MIMCKLQSSLFLLLTIWFLSCSLSSVCVVLAQNRIGARTHPDEARALSSIFDAWEISSPSDWNISGELCSGAAIDDAVNTDSYNLIIKCDCRFINPTICHITYLKVYALNVVGPIPQELWTLKYLTYLNLDKNYLTGFLSPAIGNLTRMQYMTFSINALSGPIPKEIGLLTDLRILSIGPNNFSGSIPDEIGNCINLEQMFVHSSGLSGKIPLSLANLVELKVFWIMDLELTGRIPDFIGYWTKLIILRMVGTSLSGPIPSTFSNLTNLTELRLSDISNGNSSLEFIKDMNFLNILVLRNNNLTGTIPSNIGKYSSLRQVDLSFNKIHGPIPSSLFNLGLLTHLFLGNNMLTGTLPIQKSLSLNNIDVSYNDLSGSLPSWVSKPYLKLNVVANNFTLNGLHKRILPGLNCLQKNFACSRGKGIHFNFSINCGGPSIMYVGKTHFEKENTDLGPASFFVSPDQIWAASNVGLFADASNNTYITTSQGKYVNSLDSELFRSARLSASSLRYYGLGLENGGYTVTLQFAEIQIHDSIFKDWRSLGTRRFDIYVQGRLVEHDFDIRKTAGDSTTRVIQKEYKANVSENHLEVHLFWTGKGTYSIPFVWTYGPLISAISAKPDFTPSDGNRLPSKENLTLKQKQNYKAETIVGVTISVVLLSVFAAVVMFIIQKRRKRYTNDEEILSMDPKPYTFTYSELKSATQDFDPLNKLGEGGFGSVYKGNLNDGREVAVKKLSVRSRQGKGQFVAEIVTISSVLHRNLVKLYGCCFERDHRLLVYEYLPNGSLDKALFGDKTLHLDWSTRYQICLGVARCLFYLHEEASVCIVHRDVKASNILLDSELVPKVSDFGLAKLYNDKNTHISTKVAGTIGYLAPEYAMRGHLTEKADVYAFGVVALELVSGRRNVDEKLEIEKKYLLEWAWNLHEKGRDVELVDDKLSEYNMEEVKRMIGIALLCTQTSHALRPPMSRVVNMLLEDVEVNDTIPMPGYPIDYSFDETSSSSFSNFQTKDTSFSTSFVKPSAEIVLGDTIAKPMIGFNIKEGR